MTKIEKLLTELCPNGVEYKTIQEAVGVNRGKRLTKSQLFDDGKYEVYHGSKDSILGKYYQYNAPANTTIVVNTGGIGGVKFLDRPFWCSDGSFWLGQSDSINSKFLYYCLSGYEDYFHSQKRVGGVPTIDRNVVADFRIPVPPMDVQDEIVRILDSFTGLTAELAAKLTEEFTARKQQYDYYHNSLMDFSSRNVEYKSVGELFDIRNGLNKEKSAFGKGHPIINFTDVYNKRWLVNGSFKGLVDVTPEEIERYSAKKGDVFFTRTSETKEDIGMSSTLIEDIPNCVFSGFVLRARPTTNLLLPKFCSYYFSTKKVRDTIVRYASITTRATTTGPKLSKIMVPIIPLEEQQRIVNILDEFNVLCNSITAELPVEIEERQKQYEYYRDKLLTFKERVD